MTMLNDISSIQTKLKALPRKTQLNQKDENKKC